MKKDISLLAATLLSFLLISCKSRTDADLHGAQVKRLESTEYNFSKMSGEKGMRAAFLQYLDSSAVLLRPGHYPIIGKEARQFLENIDDSSFTLTWEPSGIEVASSGDIGYTYGIYHLTEKDTAIRGTYATIWKKQADGQWKFVLDTGNPGTGKEK